MSTTSECCRRLVKRELGLAGLNKAYPGAICLLQHWSGAVNPSVHLRCLVPKGVFACDADGTPRRR